MCLRGTKSYEMTCDVVWFTGLKEATLRDIRAIRDKIRVICASANIPGVSVSS